MNKKNVILAGMILIIIVGVIGISIYTGKIGNGKQNEYSSDYGYFDEERKYVSEISMEYDLQTDEVYKENIKLKNNKNHSVYVSQNELSKDIIITLKNGNSNTVFKEKLKSKQKQILLGNKEIKGGDYTMEISLKEGTKGTLEIKVDEK